MSLLPTVKKPPVEIAQILQKHLEDTNVTTAGSRIIKKSSPIY